MVEYTPGPWHKDGLSVIADYEQDGNRHQCHVADATQRNPMRYPSVEEHANARLIAAAPDLLAALKKAEPFVLASQGAGSPFLTTVRAAIAKAEGRE